MTCSFSCGFVVGLGLGAIRYYQHLVGKPQKDEVGLKDKTIVNPQFPGCAEVRAAVKRLPHAAGAGLSLHFSSFMLSEQARGNILKLQLLPSPR